ncbi:hypothetical protein [Rufibacter sp. LB8]|uniref:hypothetical protein n=1 Tax=Rufibacter sp. LB8 TaxID=2777781 RepID=UPI00178C70A7|nr:hypothetical protein [Rufibacter sp. LB8]
MKRFTHAAAAGLLFCLNATSAQAQSYAAVAKPAQPTAQNLPQEEIAKIEYHRKVMLRKKAREDAKSAKIAAREAHYLEEEALEVATQASKLAKAEEKAQRKEEKAAARAAKKSENTVK